MSSRMVIATKIERFSDEFSLAALLGLGTQPHYMATGYLLVM